MSEIWAIIVSVIIFMIIYGYISSKISNRKNAKIRNKTTASFCDSLKIGVPYDIHLSDRRVFENVKILGNIESGDVSYSFTGYETMLVLEQTNGKKIYLKQNCIRFVAEV